MTDQSFGFVPTLHQNGAWRFLLVEHNAGHWSFPKGHKNPGETDRETAERELFEETGLKVTKILQEKPLKESYSFTLDNKKVDKDVYYFIAEVEDKPIELQSKELKNFAWLEYKDALKRMTFPEGREVLKEAFAFLNTRGLNA